MKSSKWLLWFALFFLIQAKDKNSSGNRRNKICTAFSSCCTILSRLSQGILEAMAHGRCQVLLYSNRNSPSKTLRRQLPARKPFGIYRNAGAHISHHSLGDSSDASHRCCWDEPDFGNHRSLRLCLGSSQKSFPLGDSQQMWAVKK